MDAPLIVAICTFMSVSALMQLGAHLIGRKSATVQRRITGHAVAIAAGDVRRQERIEVLKQEHYSSVAFLNALLSRLRPARTAIRELAKADVALEVGPYLALRLLVGGVIGATAWLVSGILVAAFAALAVGLMVPRLWLLLRARKRIKAFEAQLAEAIDLLVGSLRAGHGFLQGMESVSREMAEPMSKELAKVLEQINVGVNPVDALLAMADRLPSYDLSLMVAAISVQRQTGGNLAEVLENLASTVRERRRVRGEVRALTTGPRVSGYVLAVIPFALFFYFITISASYRSVMLHTSYGAMLLSAACVWSLIGFFFANKLSRVEY